MTTVPTTSYPAVQKGLSFLQSGLSQQAWRTGERLPSLATLAQLANISRGSMWKALARAKGDGLLTITPRGPIIAGNKPPSSNDIWDVSPGKSNTKWRQKLALIKKDIVNGAFSETGALPPKKELMATYEIAGSTLRKVIRRLTNAGFLVARNRRLTIPFARKSGARNTIMLFSDGMAEDTRSISGERLIKIIDSLELLCARQNTGIDCVGLDPNAPGFATQTVAAAKQLHNPLAYILNIPWVADPHLSRSIVDLTARIAALKRPLAIFDSTGEFAGPEAGSIKNVQVFRIASRLAGRQAGRHLASHGHTRIAYLSHVHDSLWSQERLAGLMDTSEMAGSRRDVVPVVVNNTENLIDTDFWMGSVPIADVAPIKAIRSDPGNIQLLEDFLRGKKFPKEKRKKFQNDLEALKLLRRTAVDPTKFVALRDAILAQARYEGESIADMLFSDAIRRDCTAWALCNDGLAIKALDYLKRSNVRVPGDVSVIGFDNTMASFEQRLSTYDFNMPGLVHRMLWFINQYDDRKKARPQPPIEVEGMVIERGTTGRAKR
jgi:DNA-binding LacI/PurR family transcriptional regulator/DNA-binding FadR family transcriptional regulator